MARRRKKIPVEEIEMEMTPMIDIVFQLLIFFLLSAKFIALEGQLASYLPKDRGLSNSPATLELASIDLYLEWSDTGQSGTVRCVTTKYKPADGGEPIQQYEFPTENGNAELSYGPNGDKVVYGYDVPDFAAMEQYFKHRQQTYTGTAQKGADKGIPVTINFEDKVPMQMVVNIVDACSRQGLTNVTVAAAEIPY